MSLTEDFKMQTIYDSTNSLVCESQSIQNRDSRPRLRPMCALLLACVACFQAACTSQMFSSESPKKNIEVKVVTVTVNPDVFLINGDLDAGYKVTGTIQNSGDPSVFEVTATLSCSEGEYVRKRTLLMASGEQQSMQFDFPEPTVNATDATAIVRVRAVE
jgi:hypothetical protein